MAEAAADVGPDKGRYSKGQQVLFAERRPDWFVDERTRQVGRRGLDEARKALRARLCRSGRP